MRSSSGTDQGQAQAGKKRVNDGNQTDRAARASRRYLDLLFNALLDEHYLENELRIEYLLDCIDEHRDPDPAKLANPARHMASRLRQLAEERRAGRLSGNGTGDTKVPGGLAYAELGRVRLEHLETCLETLNREGIEGDLVDFGVDRGGAAIFMRGFMEAHEMAGRVWVADRFGGGGPATTDGDLSSEADLNAVRDGFARFGLFDDRVLFLQGAPARTLPNSSIEQVALLRIGWADPEDVRKVLDLLYDRVVDGGFVILDAYGSTECGRAVDDFRSQAGVVEPLERVDWSGAVWRKRPEPTRVSQEPSGRIAADTPTRTKQKELSIVVVVHNMRREAARTLHSLSRSYQRGVDDLDYEVIVVENGSEPGQRLGEDFVCSHGAEFRYIDLGDDSTPSPAGAINRGIAAASAPVLALMIDGAHVLTPGVLRFGMLGLSTYAPAIVTAKQWYLGPGQQPQMVARGYDQELEDRLFDEIDWPANGYRLFEVGNFIGNRDWFDGEWESNCIFVPRSLLEQAGRMDESFEAPGGGFVNLDFFERMVGSPDITLVTMLGEGSFHQVHGGTTTNVDNPEEVVEAFDQHYEELRGRRFQVPPQQAHYVGSLPSWARRTKARRLNKFEHFRGADLSASGASNPMPVPDDLRADFVDAFWRSGKWHETRWLGRWTHRPATDLLIYQELIWRLRPDWIIETRTSGGGRALFLASICDLIGEGEVLSIDGYPIGNPPEHPRVTYLRGDPAGERMGAEVRSMVGEHPRGLAFLGGGAAPQVVGAFHNYAPLVPVGSYVVVEDTILEGNPVWLEFGSGPAAAVKEILREGEFVRDPSLERFALTFNVGGFLKRVR